jgi:hypothetical protein
VGIGCPDVYVNILFYIFFILKYVFRYQGAELDFRWYVLLISRLKADANLLMLSRSWEHVLINRNSPLPIIAKKKRKSVRV